MFLLNVLCVIYFNCQWFEPLVFLFSCQKRRIRFDFLSRSSKVLFISHLSWASTLFHSFKFSAYITTDLLNFFWFSPTIDCLHLFPSSCSYSYLSPAACASSCLFVLPLACAHFICFLSFVLLCPSRSQFPFLYGVSILKQLLVSFVSYLSLHFFLFHFSLHALWFLIFVLNASHVFYQDILHWILWILFNFIVIP